MEVLHTIVLIIHVISATVIIGVSFVTLVSEVKKFSSPEILRLHEMIWKIAGMALGLQLLTGLYLTHSEWDKIGNMPYFWIKIFLFFVVGGVVGSVNRRRFKQIQNGQTGKGDINWAIIGFLTFITLAALGVLIAESAA